jgi:hypothetical protein
MGDTRWSGTTDASGTTLFRNSEQIARVSPVGDPAQAAVLDLRATPALHIGVAGRTATVTDATATVRTLTTNGKAIVVDRPAATVVGTDDLVLAAMLASPELQPEVRILAACERVLVKGS